MCCNMPRSHFIISSISRIEVKVCSRLDRIWHAGLQTGTANSTKSLLIRDHLRESSQAPECGPSFLSAPSGPHVYPIQHGR
uniref:Uncharacterized protein n=1 Tax=Haemonchus contortus TaxID=6289 RepID=A0A7I5E6I6_HAECO